MKKYEGYEAPNRGVRKGFDRSGGVSCGDCFEKYREIEKLKLEIVQLKAKVKRLDRKPTIKAIQGAHTPSSRIDFKKNSKEDLRHKKGGASPGHRGFGRSKIPSEEALSIQDIHPLEQCPDCGGQVVVHEMRERTVIESQPLKAERILYRVKRCRCKNCKKSFTSSPSVLPKFLYGNRLLSQAAVMHYVHGVPIGRLLEVLGPEVTAGGIFQAFHSLGKLCQKALPPLIEEYRKAPVRHADETGWRTDGHSGYAWIFTTPDLSLFDFADSRASSVPRKVFGGEPLGGVLVVDRYASYNKLPVSIQYCYAHLLREIEKLDEEFGADKIVNQFTAKLIPLLAEAMKLRSQEISDDQFFERAQQIKRQIQNLMMKQSAHLAVRRIQDIFLTKKDRLYHWAGSRAVPAENNLAERELRPTVIARKVSFGSQSTEGAKTRSALLSILFTAKKHLPEKQAIETWFHQALDSIAKNSAINIFNLLPPKPQ